MRIGWILLRGRTGGPFLLTWLLFGSGGPSTIAATLGGLHHGIVSISGIFDKHLAAESCLFQPSESSQTTGVLLDGQVIFPLSPRRKCVLVSCASLQAGQGCLFHIINGQRNLGLIYFTHRNESLFFQEEKKKVTLPHPNRLNFL